MTLILNGTDNSVSTPAVTGTDTDTGVYYPAANQVALATNGTQAMLVDSSQNVGVGTASPSVKFEVSGTAVAVARIGSSQTSPNNILMTGGSSYNYGVIGVNTGNNTSGGDVFQLGYTASAGAAPTSVLQWSSAAKCIGLNTTPATSGTGITFPATQSASSDANTLDDYEEGTWTPSFTSVGASFTYPRGQYGSYIKIGSLVYAQFYIGADATGTTSNANQITGFPFASANLGSLAQASATAWVSQTQALGFTMDNNSTLITMWKQNAGSATTATAAQTVGGYIVGIAVYRAST